MILATTTVNAMAVMAPAQAVVDAVVLRWALVHGSVSGRAGDVWEPNHAHAGRFAMWLARTGDRFAWALLV